MIKQPKAIVLGGTSPHIGLISNLKNRGYYVILLDYNSNPPAKAFADEFIQESTLDLQEVLNTASQIKPDLIISTSIDQANLTACYVGERLNLPIPYSYKKALQVTQKSLMKQIMVSHGIPTTKFQTVSEFEELEIELLKFPLVIKPEDSSGSNGVRKASTINELKDYFFLAKNISRSGNVIVEEFFNGSEFSVDYFVSDSKAHLLMVREKFQFSLEEKAFVIQSPGSYSPAITNLNIKKKLIDIGQNLSNAFGFFNTSLLVQVLVSGDDISVIEFAPRIGGGLSSRTILLNTEFDILDATIDSFIGKIVEVQPTEAKSYLATIIIYCNSGILERIEGIEELIAEKIILEFHQYKTRGMLIGEDMSTKSRVGAFIVQSDSMFSLDVKIKEALNRIMVFDEKGNNIFRRDVYGKISDKLLNQ